MTAVLRGVVQLPEGDHPDREVTVLLQLQEVSRADAAADVVATDRHTANLPATGAGSLPFELSYDESVLDPRGTYLIRCHIDTTGSGSVDRGDYLTTAFQPLPMPLDDRPMVIQVQRI